MIVVDALMAGLCPRAAAAAMVPTRDVQGGYPYPGRVASPPAGHARAVAASLAALAALVAVHLAVPALGALRGVPRSRWLSLAGGTAVAYVVVHLLPELAAGQEALAETGALPFLERHAYLLALAGLATFYGVQLHARRTGGRGAAAAVGVGAFAVYNGVIGYLLAELGHEGDAGEVALFAAAMGVHFLVTDYALEERHGSDYRRRGRAPVVAALVAGWLLGLVLDLSEAAVALPTAFLAGGVVLNVLTEELPEGRRSRFSAFALGAAGYAALLLALEAA